MNQPIEFNDVHFYVYLFATISEVKEFFKDASIQTYQR